MSTSSSGNTQSPAFTLKDADGNDVSLSDFEGKVVILDFWATWCPPCRAEIPGFIELQRDYGEKGLQVVGVSLDQQGWSVINPFVVEYGINYPVVLLTDPNVYNAYQELLPNDMRGAVPFTFILEGSKLVPKIMLTRRKTAGIRVPDHPICLAIVEELGNPIISTSAKTPDGSLFEDPR